MDLGKLVSLQNQTVSKNWESGRGFDHSHSPAGVAKTSGQVRLPQPQSPLFSALVREITARGEMSGVECKTVGTARNRLV